MDLRLFGHYSKVVQWIKDKQKTMVKQLITIVTFLLLQDESKTIYYACAILDINILT